MATIEAIIKPRRGTAAAWASANPTLSQGEHGFETDTGRTKVGDGVAPWNSLSYSDVAAKIADSTSFGRSLITAADAAAARTLLSVNNVENTADLSKPISTATQTAMDANLVTATGRAVAFAIAI